MRLNKIKKNKYSIKLKTLIIVLSQILKFTAITFIMLKENTQ